MTTLTVEQAAAALSAAGWSAALIPTMIGIGKAESGLRVDAVSPRNSNGTVDHGWLQINSVHSQYVVAQLLQDPVYTARAALDIYSSQGLKAWSTWTSGAYRAGVPGGSIATVPAPTGGLGTEATAQQASWTNPLAGASSAVAGAVKPFAYKGLVAGAGVLLIIAGLWRATQAPRRKAQDAASQLPGASGGGGGDPGPRAATGAPGPQGAAGAGEAAGAGAGALPVEAAAVAL